MAADEHSSAATAPSRQRTFDRRVAVRRLEAALIEQARLDEGFQRSLGTSSEQTSYSRLRAATRRVSACDQAVKALTAHGRPSSSGGR